MVKKLNKFFEVSCEEIKKPKKVKKIKSLKRVKNNNFKLIPKVLNKKNEYGLTVFYYDDIPQELKLSKNDEGQPVIIAKHGMSVSAKLVEYHDVNEQRYPNGGIMIWNETHHQYECYYLDSAILHPNFINKTNLNKTDDNLKDNE